MRRRANGRQRRRHCSVKNRSRSITWRSLVQGATIRARTVRRGTVRKVMASRGSMAADGITEQGARGNQDGAPRDLELASLMQSDQCLQHDTWFTSITDV